MMAGPRRPLAAGDDVRLQGIFAEVEKWREEIRDWRKLCVKSTAEQIQELRRCEPPPRTPRLYSTHLRRPPPSLLAQKKLEGLLHAVAVGTLQACQDAEFWAPSFQNPSRERKRLRAPLSHVWQAPAPTELVVAREQDAFELLRSFGHRRCAIVHFASGPPALRDLRDAQIFLRTTYLYAWEDMPRQTHRQVSDILSEGSLIYTAHVTLVRGDVEDGAPWLEEPVEVEVLTASLQRTPRCDAHEQYSRLDEKAEVVKTIDDIFLCAEQQGVEVLIFPPFIGGCCGCYHPPADAGEVLRKATLASSISTVAVAPLRLGALPGLDSFASAVLEGRQPIPRLPPIPLHLSPYFNCYMGKKKPDFTVFTLGKAARANIPLAGATAAKSEVEA